MPIQEKDGFMLRSSFGDGQLSQRLDIRYRFISRAKGLPNICPLIFRVDVYQQNSTEPILHTVLIQHRRIDHLIAYQAVHDEEARKKRLPSTDSADYLKATLFWYDLYSGRNRYNIHPLVGGYNLCTSLAYVNVGESLHYKDDISYQGFDDWFDEVRDEGDMRVFTVRCFQGENKIAIPKDLRPYVGKFGSEKTPSIFPQKDLAKAVKFDTYPSMK